MPSHNLLFGHSDQGGAKWESPSVPGLYLGRTGAPAAFCSIRGVRDGNLPITFNQKDTRMTFLSGIGTGVAAVVQFTAVVMMAPLIQGIIKTVKARAQRRLGAPIMQPYADLA